jgi:hypothetical protein
MLVPLIGLTLLTEAAANSAESSNRATPVEMT